MITGKIRCLLKDNGDISEFQFLGNDRTLWSRFLGPGSGASPQGILRLDDSMYEDYDTFVLDKELTLDRWLVLTEGRSVSDLAEELGIGKCIKGLKMLEPLREAYDMCSGVCDGCPLGTFCHGLSDGLDIQSWYCGLQDMQDVLRKRLNKSLEDI